jgi:hypothetical protein
MTNLLLVSILYGLAIIIFKIKSTYCSIIFNCDFDSFINENSTCFANKSGDILITGNKLDIVDAEPIPFDGTYHVTDVKSITSLTKQNVSTCNIPYMNPIKNITEYFCYLNATNSYVCKTKLDTYDECIRGKYLYGGSYNQVSKYILTYEFNYLITISLDGLYRFSFYNYYVCLRTKVGVCTDIISINYKYTGEQYIEIYRKNNSEKTNGWKQEFIELNLQKGQIQVN